ncbi:Ubiquitin domain-containing protein [Melia azedarach]|uniref:Ubiquitin domain-containing protein n=1 Tax=Melia azedarach TaxID=155640 RepID=A0ACC1YLW7_MELAZ|nr:Ubiquitin domain-containing protein [Melia azedarach]
MVLLVISGGQVVPEIEMPISATILQLKERIEAVINILVLRQTLSFNDNVLRNDQTIDEFNFGKFATVVLDVQPLAGQPKFNIFVQSSAEEVTAISVRETTLVAALKRKIEKSCGVLAKNVSLYHLSKEMEDEFPLCAYYVCPGSEVEMTISMDI